MNLTFHTIEWTVTDRIGHLILSQPPSNKMTIEFFREMTVLNELILKSTGLKAIMISGKGRHFSSGADLDELLKKISGMKDPLAFLNSHYATLSSFENLHIPVISMIRGVCLGSALELAFFSHFRICGEEAIFGLPETTFNLIPGIGGIQRFAAISGRAQALDFLLTGRTFDAQTALGLGVADVVYPKRQLLEKTQEFALWLPENYLPGMRNVYLQRFLKGDMHYHG